MISRVILLASLVFELGSTTVSAEVPTDPEGFTKYVLNKFETAMPDHSFAYAGPLHIHDSKIGADTVGDEYLNGLFSLIVQKPESAETTVTRYVEKTAMLVADLRTADEKHVATGDFGPPFPDLGSGDRGLIVYVSKSSQNRYVEVSRWAGKGEIPEDLGRESDFRGFVRFLRPIYPHYEFVPSGQGDHCFPFGDGRGFVRETCVEIGTRDANHASSSTSNGAPIFRSVIMLIEAENGRLCGHVMDEKKVNEATQLGPEDRFLGKLDKLTFYWDAQHKDCVFARESTDGNIRRWTIPKMLEAYGVLRGNGDTFDVVILKETPWAPLRAVTAYRLAVECRMMDAIRVNRQSEQMVPVQSPLPTPTSVAPAAGAPVVPPSGAAGRCVKQA